MKKPASSTVRKCLCESDRQRAHRPKKQGGQGGKAWRSEGVGSTRLNLENVSGEGEKEEGYKLRPIPLWPIRGRGMTNDKRDCGLKKRGGLEETRGETPEQHRRVNPSGGGGQTGTKCDLNKKRGVGQGVLKKP